MKIKLLHIGLIGLNLGLTGCLGNGSENKINKPGNLVADIKEINQDGQRSIEIKNTGETKITINDVGIKTEFTSDEVIKDDSNCYNTTLYPNQKCLINLKVYPSQAGVDTLNLNTSVGLYNFPISIDTSNNSVIDTDTKSLTSTKEREIEVQNKGSVALSLSSISLEPENKTLTLKDINCLKNELAPNKTCKVKVKATAGNSILHTMFFSTTNKYLKDQQVTLQEKTDTNKLSVFLDNRLMEQSTTPSKVYQ